eukprot:12888756-Alexandrium_andersonii.AAC.1
MDKVEKDVRRLRPLALTPIFSFPDIEYADDTVIISKVAEVASLALQRLQAEAALRGLFLNHDKTVEIPLHSDQRVFFLDGSPVPIADHTKYLGTIITSSSDLSRE